MRQATSKSGYLDVKLPAKARGRGPRAWKAWKRRWIVLHGLHDLATGGTVVTLDMYQNASVEGQQLERSTIYLEAVTLVQRATSRSHPYTFCVEARQTVVYLAATCETDTQEWMDVFRNVVWPTVIKQEYTAAFNELYPVAVIDPTFSSLFGVRGGSCHLIVTENMLQLRCNHTGHVLLEWPLTALARVYMANNVELKDQYRIFIIEPRPHCGGWTALLNLFSSKAQEIVRHMTKCMRNITSDPNTEGANVLGPFSKGQIMAKWDPLGACNSSLNISTEDIASVNSEILFSSLYDSPKLPVTNKDFSNDYVYQTPPNQTKFAIEAASELLRESYYDQPRRYSEADKKTESKLCKEPMPLYRRQFSLSETDLNKFKISTTTRGMSQSCSIISIENELNSPCIPSYAEEVKLRTKPSRLIASEKFMSVCSSISSRDSGVQMGSSDENAEKVNEAKRDNVDESVQQACNEECPIKEQQNDECRINTHQSECKEENNIDEQNICIYPDEMSVSVSEMDTEIYYEIDNDETPIRVEPMYEDLDHFRKDINKLLGIPISAGQNLISGVKKEEDPPPLPPRSTRKKDVFQYLGIDDLLDREMIRTRQSSISLCKEGVRRKNLCKYLGVNNSNISLAENLNESKPRRNSSQIDLETTYDVPLYQNKKLDKIDQYKKRESKSRKIFKLFKEKDEPIILTDSGTVYRKRQPLSASKLHSHLSASLSFKDCNMLNNPISSSQSVNEVNNFPVQNFCSLRNSATKSIDKDHQSNNSIEELYLDKVQTYDDSDINNEVLTDSPQTATVLYSNLNFKIYEEFATQMLNEIWSSINKESNSTPEILISISEVEATSNTESEKLHYVDIPVDSHYMDMAYKLRDVQMDHIEAKSQKEPLYQAMIARTISNLSCMSFETGKFSTNSGSCKEEVSDVYKIHISQEENVFSENKGNDSLIPGNSLLREITSCTNNLLCVDPNFSTLDDDIYINVKKAIISGKKTVFSPLLQFESGKNTSTINEELYITKDESACEKQHDTSNLDSNQAHYKDSLGKNNMIEDVNTLVKSENKCSESPFCYELLDLTVHDNYNIQKNDLSNISENITIVHAPNINSEEYPIFIEDNMEDRSKVEHQPYNNSFVNRTKTMKCEPHKLLNNETSSNQHQMIINDPLEPSCLLNHQCSLLNDSPVSVLNEFENTNSAKALDVTFDKETNLNQQHFCNQIKKSSDICKTHPTHSNEQVHTENLIASDDDLPNFATLLLQWKRNSISAQQTNNSRNIKNDK